MLGDLVSQALVGALVLLGAREHLLHVLSHGLLVVTVAVSSRGVVLHNTPHNLALLCCCSFSVQLCIVVPNAEHSVVLPITSDNEYSIWQKSQLRYQILDNIQTEQALNLTLTAFFTPSPPVPRVGLCMACSSVPGMFFLMSWPVCSTQRYRQYGHASKHVKTPDRHLEIQNGAQPEYWLKTFCQGFTDPFTLWPLQ